ncbi:MAG: PaaI family thioesterase [Synergistales bacterium]|nr:PaaI family thioesterase [Synergistales bacterium]
MAQQRRYPGCFVCGLPEENPRALQVPIEWDAEGQRTYLPFTPDRTWCGFEDVVHGGILTAICDDAMAWALREQTGQWAATGSINVRYRAPVKTDAEYRAVGRVERIDERKAKTAAEITDLEGTVFVEATAIFVFLEGRPEKGVLR